MDENNDNHSKLAELSEKAHEIASKEDEDELREVEVDIDREVARLFGLSEKEVGEVNEALRVVYGEVEVVDAEEKAGKERT